jgi:sarcosine oxidase subunit beta
MVPRTSSVVIIGGGVVGLSIAYYLAKAGMKGITVLEKDLIGEGSTGRCAGGVRLQFSTPINIQFSLASMETFLHFEDEFGVSAEFKQTGYLFLSSTPEEFDLFKENAAVQKSWGIAVELLNPKAIKERWPHLYTGDLTGGTFCDRDGYAGPYEVVQGFARRARDLGAKIMQKTEALGIGMAKGKVESVIAREGIIATETVVNAAGPYASQVGKMAGIDIPVRPVRRQIFVTGPFDRIKNPLPVTIDFHNCWYFRREHPGYLLAGPQDEESSFNTMVDFESMITAARKAVYRAPVFKETGIIRGWAGLYDLSPDNHAILGKVPEVEGFICANGFSGHGFMHAPVTGKLIAQLVMDGRTKEFDISRLSIERFRKGELIREPMVSFQN